MHQHSWIRAAFPLACVAALATMTWRPALQAQAGSRERTVYVSALDREGVPVDHLDVDDVLVRENGVRREVLRVARATEPIDITVLIDNSTAATSSQSFFRKALPPFLREIAAGGNRVALVGLADRPTVLVPSTTDANRLAERAGGLMAMPDTGMTLLDGVTEVSNGLTKRDASRAAIIAIVTDGTEFTNRYARDVVAAARQAGAAVHFVTIGQFLETPEHEVRERSFLIEQAPRATGGSHTSMLVANSIDKYLASLARDIMSQFAVVYARPESLIPPDSVEVATTREGLTVRGTPERPRKGA